MKANCYLIIVGHHASGKTTLARILAEKHHMQVVEVGAFVIRDSLNCPSCDNPLAHADHVFKAHEYLKFVALVTAFIDENGIAGNTIIVGPRRPEELSYLRARLRHAFAIGLSVPMEVREERAMARASRSNTGVVQFEKRNETETTWGLDQTIEQCDLIVEASPGPDSVAARIEEQWKFLESKCGSQNDNLCKHSE